MKQLISKGIILLILSGLTIACKKTPPAKAPLVVVEKASHDDIKLFGEYVGRIRAFKYVEVRTRVEGYLEKMMFEEGRRVCANEALFLIDPVQYKARANKAEAQLKKDIASFNKSHRDVERLKPLYEQNAVSQLDLDNAQAAFESAEANVAMSKADLAQAQLELSYTVVKSPLDGFISERYVDIGALVSPGNQSLLATVVQSDTVLVYFKMTALDYLRSKNRDVKIGQTDSTRSWQPTVEVTLADNTEYPLKGIVNFADPQVDPKTGTFGVRAELANPDKQLLPGQFTQVKFLLDIIKDAIVVPRKALIIEKGGTFIYVMRQDSIAEKRFVQTGPELPNKIVIERGLGPNETVIVEGQQKLNPGMKIIPVAANDTEAIKNLKKENN